MQSNKPFLQYVAVKLTNGEHEFSYNTFLPCADKSGLSESEIQKFLQDVHNVRGASSDGLRDGYYWTYSETAAGVFPMNRENDNSLDSPVYSVNDESIASLKAVAPELFYED